MSAPLKTERVIIEKTTINLTSIFCEWILSGFCCVLVDKLEAKPKRATYFLDFSNPCPHLCPWPYQYPFQEPL